MGKWAKEGSRATSGASQSAGLHFLNLCLESENGQDQSQFGGTRYWQRCALSNLGNGPSRHRQAVFRLCDCSSRCRQHRLKGRFKWKALRKRNRRGTRGKFRVEQAAEGIRGKAYCSCGRWRLNDIGGRRRDARRESTRQTIHSRRERWRLEWSEKKFSKTNGRARME
jgi:hypothetical protein